MGIFKLFGKEIISWGKQESLPPVVERAVVPKPRVPLPSAGSSIRPDFDSNNLESSFIEGQKVIKPDFVWEVIPVIRNLAYYNPDVSQALDNIVQLGNTGHEIKFDSTVSEAEATKIHTYLKVKKNQWAEGTAGMDGLVNKMIAQLMIGGAISGEWVVANDQKGIARWTFLNPENVRAIWNDSLGKYEWYQQLKNTLMLDKKLTDPTANRVKLNPETYRYFAINGDTDLPYGIPPYLSSIGPLTRQKAMNENIDFIIEQLGLMGFLSILIDKPDKQGDESWTVYEQRLEERLPKLKDRIKGGFKDGIVAGYIGDTEMEFHSITKDIAGVNDTFNNNELQVASALKQDASLMGRSYGTTETQITVIFTKLLSQIKNIQAVVKRNLEFGYTLDLRLAGFNFKALSVEFNQSTVLDELKYQQGMEVKIRNLNALFYDGIISLDEYAQAMGKEKADEKEIRFVRNSAALEDELREKAKDASDKKVRDKNKPQEKKQS